MSIKYNGKSITIPADDQNKNLLVYSHPGDEIKFDFDISSLNKKIINGDLVIYLLNGCTLTVVNFGLMALDNKAPVISDVTRTYNPFSLFDNSYYYEDNSVSPYIVSRYVSSPNNNVLPEGKELSSSKDLFIGENSLLKNNSQIDENGNTNNNEVSPMVQEYIIRTLFSNKTKLEDSMVNYISNNKYKYEDPYSDIYPIKLMLINPKITPEYGCLYQLEKSNTNQGYNDLTVFIGGGKLQGNDYAHFMYEPEIINLSTETNKVWFDGQAQTNVITRWFYLGLPTPTIAIDKVIVSGLPNGVKVPKGLEANLAIKPMGGGAYEIKVKGSNVGGVEIPLQYSLGLGGAEGLFAAVSILYEGTQTRTGDAIKGSITSFFEFKPVYSADDISNYDKFNTFTYSTLRDPLILWFTGGDDVIKGGKGNYTYYGNAGNNQAYGGEADEIFHLGVGNNSFYAGFGNATVDVDNVNNKNSLYLHDAIEKADSNSIYTTINNGKIYFGGKHNGKTFLTTATDFTYLYFVPNKINLENENKKCYELTISSTKNLKADINAFFGDGNNLVKGDNSPMTVEVRNGNIFVRTDNTIYGVSINWDQAGNSYVLGSFKNDTVIGSNDDISIRFDGTGRGDNTADYSNVTLSFTYDALTGSVSKEGARSSDLVKGIKYFIGGLSGTTFYGNINADIKYIGSTESIENQNILSYIKLESSSDDDKVNNGVTIDLSNCLITKHKTKGVDSFFKIGSIQSSNNNDTFIVSNQPVSKVLDGMGGFNTIDYSKLEESSLFNIYEKEPGTVEKGENGKFGVDTIRNFQCFIGSLGGSTFKLWDTFEKSLFRDNNSSIRFILKGKAYKTSNEISYSVINGKSMVVDLKPEDSTVTIYSGKDPKGNILAIDKLSNIGKFFLSAEANNIIYAYDSQALESYIDGGIGGNNIISFEKTKNSINIDFTTGGYNNIINIKKIILGQGNDTVIVGPYCFVDEIDGFGGVNKVDFTSLGGPLTFNIDLLNIYFDIEILPGKTVTFRNFQQILSTFSDDTYNIIFDLKHIDKIKDKNILLDGNLGNNYINFDKVIDSVNPEYGLTIDLSEVFCSVKDVRGNDVLKFTKFNKVVGSRGGDIFILPKGSLFYDIDGNPNTVKGALNAVSYQAYTNGIYINKDIFERFKNIQKIIGSQGDDIIELDKNTSFNTDGYDGFNTVQYYSSDSFNDVKVTISNVKTDIATKSLIKIDKGNGKIDILSTIGFINFENNKVTNGVEYYVDNKDNTYLNKNGKVFLSGSKVENGKEANSKIVYKEDLTELTLNLKLESLQITTGNWISIKKGTGSSVDYLQNINSITLSKNSTVNIFDNIGNIQNIRNLMVDGRENSTLSFEHYSMDAIINVADLKNMSFQNNIKISFNGFVNFKASGMITTKFTFISAADKNYTFNGMQSECTLSYEKINENITIDVTNDSKTTDNIFNSININKGQTTDKAYNITNIIGSKGVTKILINYSFKRNMSFIGEASKRNENTIDYSGLSENDHITFLVTKGGVLAGRSSGEYNDTIKNINKIIGGKGNTRFSIEGDIIDSGNVYELDGGKGTNILSLQDINTNIEFNLDTQGVINVNVNNNKFASVKNIHVLFGTSLKANTFKLGNFFEGKYFANGNLQLYGSNNSINDILDLTASSKGFSLDPLSGKIVESNGDDKLALITMTGISSILLGDGNHQIDISSKASYVGWKKIVGGKGHNNVSFERMITSIKYDLSQGVEGLSFQLINFSGVTGTKNNDIFYLNENKINGIRINGNGGLHNILDYSKLNVYITVDINSKKVTRGDKTDVVENISIFKSGTVGGKFISTDKGFYEFHGSEDSSQKSILDYSNINSNLIFSFINNSVIKPNSFYDKFYNVTEFIGGSGESNNFLFALGSISEKISEIIINGGKGKNNIINLAQLEKGIVYDVDKKFFEVYNQGNKLKVILKNINKLIGSSYQDTFIFSDSSNGISVNGGNNIEGTDNIIDLSKISNSVTVDFERYEILYSNNKNYFINVFTFIGSKKGGDTFRGLNNYNSYNLTGGAGGNNTVAYNNCSAPITLQVVDDKIVLFKGGISDKLANIQNITLSNLSDKIIFNQLSDFKTLSTFKVIDGGEGDNEVHLNFKVTQGDTIIIDLLDGKINISNNTYNINLKNFRVWSFSKEGYCIQGSYTIVAPKDLGVLKSFIFPAITDNTKSYENTLDIRHFTGNINIFITYNAFNNIKLSLSSINISGNVYLENFTLIKLPSGNHLISYGTVAYNGKDNSTVNLKLEADFNTTSLSYFFETIQNDLGNIYISYNSIKFSEDYTTSDIRFVGKLSTIFINRLVAPKNNVVLLFGDAANTQQKDFSFIINDWVLKDNTVIIKNNAKNSNNKVIKISFLSAESTSIFWGEQTLKITSLGKTLPILDIDPNNVFSTLSLDFYSYKATFSQLVVDYASRKEGIKYNLDFSKMDSPTSMGSVYAKFDIFDKFETYPFSGVEPSESNKFFAILFKNINELNSSGAIETSIISSKSNSCYEFIVSDKKLPNISGPYIQRYNITGPKDSTYSAKVSLVNKYNDLKFESLTVLLTQGMLRIHETRKDSASSFFNLRMEAKENVNHRADIILNVADKITNKIHYNFEFSNSNATSINSITLTDPSISYKYFTTNNIRFSKNMFTENTVTNIATVFDMSLKNDHVFCNMFYGVNNSYQLNISNIKLSNNSSLDNKDFNNIILLSNSGWWHQDADRGNNIVYFQSNNKDVSFIKCILNTQLELVNTAVTVSDVMSQFIVDASSMSFGTKDDIPNMKYIEFNYSEFEKNGLLSIKAGFLDKKPITVANIRYALSFNIQREDMSFPVYAKMNNKSLLQEFSFGDVKSMKLPSNKHYQIFTNSDSFLSSGKYWNGKYEGEIEKTYTNVADIYLSPNKDGKVAPIDINVNSCFATEHRRVKVHGANYYKITQGWKEGDNSKGVAINLPEGIATEHPFTILNFKIPDGKSVNIEKSYTKDVVVRILRDDYKSNGINITFTNNCEYNDPNFKYYGTLITGGVPFIKFAEDYTMKSCENRDYSFIRLQFLLKNRHMDFSHGTYSFSGVDLGYKNITCGQKENPAIIHLRSYYDSIAFRVMDFDLVHEASKGAAPLTSAVWLDTLRHNSILNNVQTRYSHISKIIITGHKSYYNLPADQQIALFVAVDQLFGTNDSCNIIFQRDIFKGDPNNMEQVNKYLSDFVALGTVDRSSKDQGRYKGMGTVLFNEKNIGISIFQDTGGSTPSAPATFLLKDGCGASPNTQYLNETVFNENYKSFNLIFSSYLEIPSLMSKGARYYFGYKILNKNGTVTVILPKDTGYTYNYSIQKNSNYSYKIDITLKDLQTGSDYSYYCIHLYAEGGSSTINFIFNDVNSHMNYIEENFKDLYYLTMDGNEYKTKLDEVKDLNKMEKYITWDNKQNYLDSLDQTTAKYDYWNLIDKQIENAFKVNNVYTNNNQSSETQISINNAGLNSKDYSHSDEDLTENLDKDNDDTNHGYIFESSDDAYWDENLNTDKEDGYNNKINNTEALLYEDTPTEGCTNHSYQDSGILENETNLNSEQNTYHLENIGLSNLFENIKSISENIDNTILVEEFGLSDFTVEELNHTYQQDEANSMSYTIDGCNNIASTYSNDYTIEITTQENQKNKTNH